MSCSNSTGALAAALAKAQGAMVAAQLDRENPFYKSKYATLASIWEAIRKPLSDNELAVTQVTYPDDGRLILETTLLHSSGEWVSAQLIVKPVKDDPQGIGSAISYARRYGLSAIVGAVSDEDDDGTEASRKPEAKSAPQPHRQHTVTEAMHAAEAAPKHDADAATPAASDPKPEAQHENGKGLPASLGPGASVKFDELAREFVKVYPRYLTKDNKPDRFHLLMAAGKCGWKLIQVDHVEEAFAQMAARAEKLDNPQPALVEA